MFTEYKKYELFGKTLVEKITLATPGRMIFPNTDNACFLYMLDAAMAFNVDDETTTISNKDALLLNCKNFGKEMQAIDSNKKNEVIIVHFHADVLKKVYDKEFPSILKNPVNPFSNKASERINNDFLVTKYIEGLLFYFENPTLINEEILVLKLKEIILLLSQTPNAEAIQLILSQLFSPVTYSFKQIIEAHLFLHITIEELAQQCNLSLSSFKREFARLYNDTPANYIKNRRLEKAATLLLSSDVRINEIAFTCGFNDLSNFSKSFYDKYLLSPSNYRLNQITK